MKLPVNWGRLAFLRKPDMIVALAATVTSICALIVAVRQTEIMQEQQRASAWPHLEWLPSNYPTLAIRVANKGVGPAIVEDVRIHYAGKDYDANIRGMFNDLIGTDTFFSVISTVEGRVITPGETITMIEVEDPRALRIYAETDIRDFPRIEICYRSIYGEYWVSEGIRVRQVERCGGVWSEE